MIDQAAVERALHALYISAEGTSLRLEDRKKAVEITSILGELRRVRPSGLLVDAAAGKAYVGLLAAELLGFTRVHVIERDARRREACEIARDKLHTKIDLHVAAGDVGDVALWPASPDVVVALHACGAASDLVIDAAGRARARWIFLVPCCYARGVAFSAAAEAKAEALGVPRHAEIRRKFVMSLVDAERALRLESMGYEVTTVSFVPPTVSPHNLLFRARRGLAPSRMREAAARLEQLRG